MNKKNKRKNSPKVYRGYLTTKQRKAVEWYEQKRLEKYQSDFDLKVDIK